MLAMPFTWYPFDQDKTVAESSDEGSEKSLDQTLGIKFVGEENFKSTQVDVFPGHHQDIPEDIPEEDQANGTASAPPVKPPKKSKKHQIETPTPLPPPPPWKIILETTVNTGIDSLFKVSSSSSLVLICLIRDAFLALQFCIDSLVAFICSLIGKLVV